MPPRRALKVSGASIAVKVVGSLFHSLTVFGKNELKRMVSAVNDCWRRCEPLVLESLSYFFRLWAPFFYSIFFFIIFGVGLPACITIFLGSTFLC